MATHDGGECRFGVLHNARRHPAHVGQRTHRTRFEYSGAARRSISRRLRCVEGRRDPVSGGAVPTLRGRDILALTPGIDQLAQLEIDDWGAYPGPHMTVERMWALRGRIVEHLARRDVDGIVVTHVTDALEESAY